jgi:50S ribosomal protein L16 3-hydroxylase
VTFGLDAFLGELSREDFYAEVWERGWHVVHGDLSRFGGLDALGTFESPWTMVAAHRGDIDVFGPGGVRVVAQKLQADELYNGGCTLYLALVARELDPFTEALAADLGCAAKDICVEGFASKAGALSTAHFDPEHNFHVILRGKKRWRLAKNESVDDPIQNFVIGSVEHKASVNHRHKRADLPRRFPDDHVEVEVEAGSSIYFARGVWHEVECDDDALSVNFAVRPPSWAALAGRALSRALEDDPALRRYVFRGKDPAYDDDIRARLHAAVDRLTGDDVLTDVSD